MLPPYSRRVRVDILGHIRDDGDAAAWDDLPPIYDDGVTAAYLFGATVHLVYDGDDRDRVEVSLETLRDIVAGADRRRQLVRDDAEASR